MNRESPLSWSLSLRLIGTFVLVVIPLFALISTSVWYLQRQEADAARARAAERVEWDLQSVIRLVQADFEDVVRDLRYLSSQVSSGGSSGPIIDPSVVWELVRARPEYDQVRILDLSGNEIVRVNRGVDGPLVVAPEDLQYKGDRYYFLDTLSSPPGSVYVSPLDLNIEGGEVELPYKPMIRFGVPLTDSAGDPARALIINYLARSVLDTVRHAADDHQSEFYLATTSGDWFVGPTPESEWGFMFPGREPTGVPVDFPVAWQQFQCSGDGEVAVDGAHFIFETVHPLNLTYVSSNGTGGPARPSASMIDPQSYRWVLVAWISAQRLQEIERAFRDEARPLVVGSFVMVILLGLAVVVLRASRMRSRLQLRRSAGRLARSNATKDLLFSIVAHDLRGPIGSIKALAETILEDRRADAAEEETEAIRAIVESATKQRDMLEDLLLWSRSQREQFELEPRLIDVADLLHAIEAEFAGPARRKGIALKIARPIGLFACVDLQTTTIAVRNLVSNAIKFTRPAGLVEVAARKHDRDTVQIIVRDSGIGIDHKFLNEIFTLKNSLRRTGTAGEPTSGLGLVLCQELVEANCGSVSADSEVARGSVFTVTLPGDAHCRSRRSTLPSALAARAPLGSGKSSKPLPPPTSAT